MNLSRNQILIIGIGLVVVIVVLLMFLGVIPGIKEPGSGGQQEIKLSVFGPEKESNFRILIEEYQKLRPNVKIFYTEISESNYEQNLVAALAAGRGPDILMFHNSWLPKHFDKLYPAPVAQLSLNQLRQWFPQVVEQDFTGGGQVYALPLYVDTLALFYNKDIFDAKSIALLPATWTEFQSLIPKLREINQAGQISRAAAAIGGSEKSISYASDLLNLVFAQFGNPKITSYETIDFDLDALDALNFYVQFANPGSAYYAWNDGFKFSLDSFAEGRTAIIFNYGAQIPAIKNKNPFLNFGVAPVPQFAGVSQPISYASYWGLAVSKQSANPAWAWDFIVNTTANPGIAENYTKTIGQSPALRVLIDKYAGDPQIGVFAKQALQARSWPKPDSAVVRRIFSDAVESVLSGRLSTGQAMDKIESEINSLK